MTLKWYFVFPLLVSLLWAVPHFIFVQERLFFADYNFSLLAYHGAFTIEASKDGSPRPVSHESKTTWYDQTKDGSPIFAPLVNPKNGNPPGSAHRK